MKQNHDIKNAIDVFKKYWGYDSFRPGQEDAIRSVLEGRETMVLFPTGGGKSLCYQVPSLILDGLTLVISPLIALMQDQVEQLKSRDIRAAFINSTLPAYEIEQRLVNARNGMYRLLYISPERLATERWKNELPNLNVSLVAVDEAHCISEWGHDFRPAYRHIRTELSDLPASTRWMALTATATPEVKKDILKCLEFSDPAIVSAGFSRPNLTWWVTDTDKKQDVFMNAVRKGVHKGSGIVYTDTRKDCEQKAARLSSAGISARAYHGSTTTAPIPPAWLLVRTTPSTNAPRMASSSSTRNAAAVTANAWRPVPTRKPITAAPPASRRNASAVFPALKDAIPTAAGCPCRPGAWPPASVTSASTVSWR